jgi:hypothetical protein
MHCFNVENKTAEKTRHPVTPKIRNKHGLPVMLATCTIASLLYGLLFTTIFKKLRRRTKDRLCGQQFSRCHASVLSETTFSPKQGIAARATKDHYLS